MLEPELKWPKLVHIMAHVKNYNNEKTHMDKWMRLIGCPKSPEQ